MSRRYKDIEVNEISVFSPFGVWSLSRISDKFLQVLASPPSPGITWRAGFDAEFWVDSGAGHKRLAKTLAMLNQVLDRWVTETGGGTAGATFMCLIKALLSRGRDRWRQLWCKLAREISRLFTTPVSTSLLCHLMLFRLRHAQGGEGGGCACVRQRHQKPATSTWKAEALNLLRIRKWGLCSEQRSQDGPDVKLADFRSGWATRRADRTALTGSILPPQKARLLYSTAANQRIANLPWHLALVRVFPEQFARYVLKVLESDKRSKRFSASRFAAGKHGGRRIHCRVSGTQHPQSAVMACVVRSLLCCYQIPAPFIFAAPLAVTSIWPRSVTIHAEEVFQTGELREGFKGNTRLQLFPSVSLEEETVITPLMDNWQLARAAFAQRLLLAEPRKGDCEWHHFFLRPLVCTNVVQTHWTTSLVLKDTKSKISLNVFAKQTQPTGL